MTLVTLYFAFEYWPRKLESETGFPNQSKKSNKDDQLVIGRANLDTVILGNQIELRIVTLSCTGILMLVSFVYYQSGLLGIFQKLIASKQNDHEGFYLMNTMVEKMPRYHELYTLKYKLCLRWDFCSGCHRIHISRFLTKKIFIFCFIYIYFSTVLIL